MFVRFLNTLEPFVFRQFELGGRFHVPLPKMSPRQMGAMRQRLESIGFTVTGEDSLKASNAGARIRVESSGLCSSNADLSDAIAPALPEILAFKPTKATFSGLRGKYFSSETKGDDLLLRLAPRLEAQAFWDELRSTGSCALTPDERLVYSVLLSSRTTLRPLVTDFPVEGSTVRRLGRRQYYDSMLDPAQAASTLRGMGASQERNTYLPRASILVLRPGTLPTEELRGTFEELGDWCSVSLR